MQDSNANTAPRRGGARPGAGRPRRAPTLAAALRDAFPIERLVKIAEEMIASESDDVRFRTLMQILDRTHGKVSDKLEVGPAGSMSELDEDAAADLLSDAELDELDRLDDAKQAILDRARGREEARALPAAVTVPTV